MIEAHRRLGQYLVNPTMPFQLWLRHIAQDHIIDAHRRHRQAQRRSLDREQYLNPAALSDQSSIDLAGQLFDKQPTPATEAIRQELRENLLNSIGDMNSDDREIILMRHVDQLSNHEVAIALEVTEAAASMRYLRAIRRLKERLSAPNNRNPNDDQPGS
jgi:RNA polymerase sigma-70 factor (ECF subfamily)